MLAQFAAAQVSEEALKTANELRLLPRSKEGGKQAKEVLVASYEGFMTTLGTGGRRR